ncbi:MAG: ABC transporter ATP-binding protein [Rhodobacterales bacterium]|nr:ABC transporter ATP-binding protein [Rhodobacterales bacterium]
MKPENFINAFRAADGPPPNTLAKFAKWALSGAWPALFLGVAISSLAGAMEAGTAFILGMIVDSAVASDPATFFRADNAGIFVIAIGFFLLVRPSLFGLSWFSNSIIIGPNVNTMVLARLHRWTLGQSVVFFDNDFAGRIAQKQLQTAHALTEVAVESINVVAFALASLVGSLILIMSIDARLSVIFLLWLSIYFTLIRWFLPRIRKRAKTRAAQRAMITGQIVDTVTNIKTVKLFALADHEERAALVEMRKFRKTALAFGRIATAFRFLLMFLAGVLPVLMIAATLYLWSRDTASTGDIVAAGSVAIRIAQMTGWVSFALMGIYSNIGEVEDGMNTLTPSVRLPDVEGAPELQVAQGEIEFDVVSFAYGREIGGVSKVSLTVKAGEKLGIVGASGAGKSTLVALLLRLYDPEKGVLRIDGQDLRTVTQESLRHKIGMVTQETAMFNRSARDNILYGDPDASDEQIIAAAKSAEAHDFIMDLVDHAGRKGYDAHLGERGVRLSGGQRQRIALARAILKDAPILVLDEATSALDSEVEAAIQAALTRVMDGKTVLAIAHRLSTISQMDRIVVLDQGRIVEVGSHDELLRLRGLYARFWRRQSGGFIGIEDAAE